MEENPEEKAKYPADVERAKERILEGLDVEAEEGIAKEEVRELSIEEKKLIKEKLEKEIELMELNPKLQSNAQKKAKDVKELDAQNKLQKLLNLAQEKGIPFAVITARAMDDPFILDVFHDILIEKGLYKGT